MPVVSQAAGVQVVLVPAFVLSGLVVFELVYEDPCWSGSHICGLLWLKWIF